MKENFLRTDHQVGVCDFLSVSGSFVSVACSGVMCSCVQSSHPRNRMASKTKRQLCAVLVLRRRRGRRI